MGKRIARKTYKLAFQPDTPLDGLTVVVRGVSLGRALEIRGGRDNVEGETPVEGMARLLAEHLVEWDAEDEDGAPIPTTIEGLLSQDADFTLTLFNAWQSAVMAATTVPDSDPLPETSADGQPSVEASIPMEIPSESLAS